METQKRSRVLKDRHSGKSGILSEVLDYQADLWDYNFEVSTLKKTDLGSSRERS
jgi:hypothetical protein